MSTFDAPAPLDPNWVSPEARAAEHPQGAERDRAIATARRILENHDPADAHAVLARQYLRAIGLPEHG